MVNITSNDARILKEIYKNKSMSMKKHLIFILDMAEESVAYSLNRLKYNGLIVIETVKGRGAPKLIILTKSGKEIAETLIKLEK